MRKLLSILFLAISAAALEAQMPSLNSSAHFVINQGNHPVGRSEFSIQTVKQGKISTPGAYTVNSHGTLTLPKTNYSFSGTGSLDNHLAIVQENLNGIVNGSAVTFVARANGGSFGIDISANGKNYQNTLNRPAQTVFFPDFDMASYEILLNIRATHPGTGVAALIPKQTGILSAATVAPQADVQATLNGKSLTVHHSSLTIGSVVSELYSSFDNHILEVDIPSQTFAIVHDNFQLQQPPPPPPDSQQQPSGGAPSSQLQ
jgi:hypothetical protein